MKLLDGTGSKVGSPDEQGVRYVPDIAACGLRFVGYASIRTWRYATLFQETSLNRCEGYYATINGDDAAIVPTVYQLPTRHGIARYVAGYIETWGVESSACVDLSTIYDAANKAAYMANQLADKAAERAREYDAAWQAGSVWQYERERLDELQSQLSDNIAALLDLGHVEKEKRQRMVAPIVRDMQASSSAMKDIRNRLEKLADGCFEPYYFWPGDAKLKIAFNEGRGETE